MSLPVFLSDAVTAATVGDRLLLDGDEGRHAATVMRLRVGERLRLTDGAGTLLTGSVVETGRGSLTVEVEEHATVPAGRPHVTVVQAIPKGDRGELAVELLTEIGVDRIVPWAASRGVAVWRGDRAAKSLAKWRAGVRTAAKQARRAWLPEVADPMSTEQVSALLASTGLALVLHEEASAPIAEVSLDGVGSLVVVVGPEGGISDEELTAFAAARAVRLGPTVLRTSTAGMAAVAALLARSERWSARTD